MCIHGNLIQIRHSVRCLQADSSSPRVGFVRIAMDPGQTPETMNRGWGWGVVLSGELADSIRKYGRYAIAHGGTLPGSC